MKLNPFSWAQVTPSELVATCKKLRRDGAFEIISSPLLFISIKLPIECLEVCP